MGRKSLGRVCPKCGEVGSPFRRKKGDYLYFLHRNRRACYLGKEGSYIYEAYKDLKALGRKIEI